MDRMRSCINLSHFKMELTTVTLVAAIIIGLIIWKLFLKKDPNFPPGPRGLPLIGNLLQLDPTGPHKTFIEWGKTYGDIFKIKLLHNNVIVVNSDELIYEVLVQRSSNFADRVRDTRIEMNSRDTVDVAFRSISPDWQRRKKLMMKNLKGFGDGLVKLENISQVYIEKMMERLAEMSQGGTGVDMKPALHYCTAGIITSVLYGEELQPSQLKELLDIEKPILEILAPTSSSVIIEILPILQYFPIKPVQDIIREATAFVKWLKRKECEMKSKPSSVNPSCMYEELLRYQKINCDTEIALHTDEIRGICANTIFAGFATTSTTIYALIGILANRLDIQEKIRAEVQSVLGACRPCLADRSKMPYTEAVILEVLRYSSILPVMIPHAASKDTTLGGYQVPKGTMIMPNVWGLHHDPRYWEEPFKFRPDRFLTPDGLLVGPEHINRKRLLPFGAGRRVCAGEALARNRLFLITASLLQRFQFLPENPESPPEVDPQTYSLAIVMHPQMFKVKVEKVLN